MLFDVHCHLNDRRFAPDLDEVVERARKVDIQIVNSAIERDEIDSALSFCGKYDNVYLTIGCSPTELDDRRIGDMMGGIKANRERIIGVGEVGLDYYWVREERKREKQRKNFAGFIELANELRLPLVVHSRESNTEVLSILRESSTPALMHCFSGTVEEALEFINLGCLISIPTSIVHSKSKQDIASAVPLESITLETDAPYQAPTPKTRNEPANVVVGAKKVAEIKGLDKKTVEDATTRNTKKFFGIR